MGEWLVILNPNAGSKPVTADTIVGVLDAESVDYRLVVPETAEEAAEVLRSAAVEGKRQFALVGGDGTVNLAVNSILPLNLDEPPLVALLPTGTGCDLLRTFGLSHDLGESARRLLTEDTYLCDVATVEGSWGTRYFINVAQAGVGAAAAETAPKLTRRMGAVRYPLAFGIRLPRFPRANVTVTTEKRVYETEALAVIMANAQFFASGWNVAPKATLVDGVLDIQIISAKKSQAPALVPKVIKGTHLADASVRRFSAAEFKIETSPSWPVEADGDLVGNTTVSGRVVPAAVRLKI